MQRLVQAEERTQDRFGLGPSGLAHHLGDGVAGYQAHQKEDQKGRDQRGENGRAEPLEEVIRHAGIPNPGACGWPGS